MKPRSLRRHLSLVFVVDFVPMGQVAEEVLQDFLGRAHGVEQAVAVRVKHVELPVVSSAMPPEFLKRFWDSFAEFN